MRKLTQRVTGFILLLAMIAAIVLVPVPMHAHAATTAASTVNASSTAVANIQDGVTLHCWNWSFKNIEANMADIAAAGYTAVQTSPIQQCKEGTVGSTVGHWWVYYQPASFVIDNTGSNALGNKAEFASMCAAAEKYGIKVIVDVVANHLGNQSGNDLASTIPADIRNDTSCWHNIKINTSNYNDRYDITQHCMAGLPDLNTGYKKIQNYVLNFLKECVDAGADGFRFDAAKHIETPEDSGCASDFWPTVINGIKAYKPDVYVYGEVLDGTGGVAMTAYTKYMSVTDNNWGNNLRNNINNGNANGFYHTYDKGVSADKIVLWAESHDTWANDDHQSTYVSETNINKTWAIVAARADAMGLYFARPKATTQKLGEASKTAWYWEEVAAVNKFHNAFVGQGEYTTKENGYVAIERGTTGVVIVNVSGSGDVNMSVSKLANGTYTDQISGNTFTVSNGRITGKITHQCGYAVIYNACDHKWVQGTTTKATCDTDGVTTYSCSSCGMTKTEVVEVAPGHKYVNDVCSVCGQEKPKGITLYFDNTSNWSTVNIYYWSEADEAMVTWPGVAMNSDGNGIYSYTVPVGVTNVIFNNGTDQTDDLTVPGNNYLYSNGKWESYVSCSHPSHNTDGICTSCGKATAHNYLNGVCSICKKAEPSDRTIYFDNSNNWGTVYIYFWNDGDISYTEWPGETMTKVDGSIYSYTVPGDTTKIIFHNNGGDLEPSANKTADLDVPSDKNLYTMSTSAWSVYGNNICNHSWGTGTVTKAATCTSAGVKTYTCSLCSATKTEAIAALGHSYVNGTCSNCGATEGTVTTGTLYLKPASNWKVDGARFAAYFFGTDGNTWVSMTDSDKDGTYEVTIPSGKYENVIFCRMNPSTTDNNWEPNVKWNQTEDLAIPSNGTNCYTVNEGTWDKGGGSWSTVKVVCTHSYDAGKVTTAATCTTAGVKTYTCTKCKETKSETIAALGHSYSSAVTTPTCTTDGYTTYTCSVCKDSYTGNTVASSGHSYSSVVTAPTCTKEGYTTYTCSVCKDSYTGNTVPATGNHTYVDGKCSSCGQAKPVVKPTLGIYSVGLSLKDEVIYNVYFTVTDTSDVVEMGLLGFNTQKQNGTISNADYIIPGTTTSGQYYVAHSNGIPAKNLGDDYYYMAYAKLSDGTYAYSPMKSYNAVKYANTILGNASSNAKLKAVVVAMLNYGAAAQVQFDYKTDALVNAGLTAEQKALVKVYDESMVNDVLSVDSNKAGEFATKYASARSVSISLKGAFAINYYLTASKAVDSGMTLYYWTEADYKAATKLTTANATGSVVMDATGTANQFKAAVEGISAKQIDETIFVVGVYESNGVTYSTGVLAYSLGKYCEQQAAGSNAALAAMAQATAVYGYYAKAYFGN